MPGKCKILSIITVFLIVFVTGLHGAYAQNDPCAGNRTDGTLGVPGNLDTDGSTIQNFLPNGWQNIYFDAGQMQLQDVSQMQLNIQQQVQHIDVKNMYCLSNFGKIFSSISNLTSTTGVSLAGKITAALITAIENQVLTSLENMVCQVVNGAISSLESAARQSLQFCLPLPHFKVPTFKFPFAHGTCNGVNILSPQFLNQQPIQGAPNVYKLMMGQ